MTSELRLIKRGALQPDATPTSGMTRAHAIFEDGLTSGTASSDPGVISGWHHHGSHETSIYVVKGTLHMEDAHGAFDAREGDFIHVPAGVVHRESNPGTEPNLAVFSRSGSGAVTVNVEDPTRA